MEDLEYFVGSNVFGALARSARSMATRDGKRHGCMQETIAQTKVVSVTRPTAFATQT